jgi:hypothetical protein
LSVAFPLLVAFLFSSSPASAAPYYKWDTAQKFTETVETLPDNPTPGQDIVAAWHAFDGTYHYFRIDLLSAPAYKNPPGYANTYGLFIDSKAGGAPTSDGFVPGTLAGIDYIVGTELEFEGRRHNRLDWDPEYLRWKGDEFQDSDHLRFQATENGHKTLEWRVKEGGDFVIGNSFTWWAASMLPGDCDGSGKQTYDVMATPIPNAAWLLGSGIIGLIGLKRRTNKRKKTVSRPSTATPKGGKR